MAETIQWFKNGDHPFDRVGDWVEDPFNPGTFYKRREGAVVRFFRRPEPEYAGEKIHPDCGSTWHSHGWIDGGGDGITVCPGNFITVNPHEIEF